MVGTTDISLYDRDKSGKSVVIKTGDVFVLFSYDSKIAEWRTFKVWIIIL